jgi:ATP-dependent RNA helicase DHX37/DHR1
LLGYLGATALDGSLTQLGRIMNLFPLSPRFAKILTIGQQHGCLPYVIAIVAALSVGDVFVPEQQLGFFDTAEIDVAPSFADSIAKDSKSKARSNYYRSHAKFAAFDLESDAIKLLAVVCAFEYERDSHEFCSRNFIRFKAMEETRKLRQQITNIVKTNCPGLLSRFDAKLALPSLLQVNLQSTVRLHVR